MFVASVFAACSDDDKIGFDLPVDVSQEAIRFTPAPGGAVMHYSLPEDKEVFGIRVRYNSVWGETVVKDGSYLNDSLLLDGFTEMQSAVSSCCRSYLSGAKLCGNNISRRKTGFS